MRRPLLVLTVLLGLPLLLVGAVNGVALAHDGPETSLQPVPEHLAEETFEAGMRAFHQGDFDLAEDLLARVPEGHARYSKAQRFVGWEIRAKRHADPASGIGNVNAALWADPTDGNAWQDAWRTYGRTLHLPVD